AAGVAYPAGGHQAAAAAVADFNRDGKFDLAVSYADTTLVGIYLGVGNGTFTGPTQIPVAGRGGIAAADFDGDGNPDFAVTGFSEDLVAAYPGNGAGGFGTGVVTTGLVGPPGLVVGDVNADGQPDIVTPFSTSPANVTI